MKRKYAKKAVDKKKHCIMKKKTLNNLGREGRFLKLIKDIMAKCKTSIHT